MAHGIASTSSSPIFKDWTFVWKLKVTNKIYVFFWHLLRNGLPVYQNLLTRKVNIDPMCSLCLHCTETVVHVFKAYQFARLVWRYLAYLPMR